MDGLTEEALKRRLAARGALVPVGQLVGDTAAAAAAAAQIRARSW